MQDIDRQSKRTQSNSPSDGSTSLEMTKASTASELNISPSAFAAGLATNANSSFVSLLLGSAQLSANGAKGAFLHQGGILPNVTGEHLGWPSATLSSTPFFQAPSPSAVTSGSPSQLAETDLIAKLIRHSALLNSTSAAQLLNHYHLSGTSATFHYPQHNHNNTIAASLYSQPFSTDAFSTSSLSYTAPQTYCSTDHLYNIPATAHPWVSSTATTNNSSFVPINGSTTLPTALLKDLQLGAEDGVHGRKETSEMENFLTDAEGRFKGTPVATTNGPAVTSNQEFMEGGSKNETNKAGKLSFNVIARMATALVPMFVAQT